MTKKNKTKLTGTVTKYAVSSAQREIRILAGKEVQLYPKHIKRDKNGAVRMVVVIAVDNIPHSKPVMLPTGYISMKEKARQHIASL